MNRMPAQIGLDVIETVALELLIQFLIEGWLGYIECVLLTKPDFA